MKTISLVERERFQFEFSCSYAIALDMILNDAFSHSWPIEAHRCIYSVVLPKINVNSIPKDIVNY